MFSSPPRFAPVFGIVALALLLLQGCASTDATRQSSPQRSEFFTDPGGASIFIDGGFVGNTPTKFFLPPKERVELRIMHPGFLPVEETLIRLKVGPDAGEGVGWDSVYSYTLTPKRH